MGVDGGIGILGISTVALLLLLLAYPGYWTLRLPALDAKPIDITQTRMLLALAVFSSIAVAPGSVVHLGGFVLVPVSVGLVALMYGAANAALVRTLARQGELMSRAEFLGFLMPPLVSGMLVMAVSLVQVQRASALGLSEVMSMGVTVLATFFLTATLPCLAAAAHIAWTRVRVVPDPEDVQS